MQFKASTIIHRGKASIIRARGLCAKAVRMAKSGPFNQFEVDFCHPLTVGSIIPP
jgi:hypothetical protein